ncbi:hypothetical protein Goshw_017017 [Gossypium schwendimanii]|uniref:CCHC-type domain-containing protein n=1 Tax=Gossypium schwendimanii TaxID=34291 RepID=A0A7J9MNR1_GOSSC|nr:hypothetical protein [Gossypium schwendimanii]
MLSWWLTLKKSIGKKLIMTFAWFGVSIKTIGENSLYLIKLFDIVDLKKMISGVHGHSIIILLGFILEGLVKNRGNVINSFLDYDVNSQRDQYFEVFFSYECIRLICYTCGPIGHIENNCRKPIEFPEDKVVRGWQESQLATQMGQPHFGPLPNINIASIGEMGPPHGQLGIFSTSPPRYKAKEDDIMELDETKKHTRDEFSSKISSKDGMCNNAMSVSSVSADSIIPVSISLPLEACCDK